jgi:hypothetical protein
MKGGSRYAAAHHGLASEAALHGKRFFELRLPSEVLANGGPHFGGAD